MSMGNVSGGSSVFGNEIEGLAKLLGDSEAREKLLAEMAEWEAVKNEANAALAKLEGEKKALAIRERELEDGQRVLDEERGQLEDDRAEVDAMRADLKSRLSDLADQRNVVDAREKNAEKRENAATAAEQRATGRIAEAEKLVAEAQARSDAMGRRIARTVKAWESD